MTDDELMELLLPPEKRNQEGLVEILGTVTTGFDLPDKRRPGGSHFDLGWLRRNLMFKNQSHPRIDQAKRLIRLITKMEAK